MQQKVDYGLLYQPFAVIGRDLRADVVLDHADVSRRHVYLQVIEGSVFWIDLESRTGTRNESDSQRFGWLEGGRTFSVGPYVIRRFVGDSQAIEKRRSKRSSSEYTSGCPAIYSSGTI